LSILRFNERLCKLKTSPRAPFYVPIVQRAGEAKNFTSASHSVCRLIVVTFCP